MGMYDNSIISKMSEKTKIPELEISESLTYCSKFAVEVPREDFDLAFLKYKKAYSGDMKRIAIKQMYDHFLPRSGQHGQ